MIVLMPFSKAKAKAAAAAVAVLHTTAKGTAILTSIEPLRQAALFSLLHLCSAIKRDAH